MEFGISRSERALRLSKYLSVFVWTYPDLCRDRRRHAHLHLNLAPFLDLDLNLNLNLNLFLFKKPLQKLVQKPFETSFGSSFSFK